jgi:hypothetical protein
MEPRLMHGLMHLPSQALAQSHWREPFAPPIALDDASPEDGPQKPRYLN